MEGKVKRASFFELGSLQEQAAKYKALSTKFKRLMLRAIAIILGIVLAAVGGVIAYRAYFLEPSAEFLISSRGVRELPDTYRTIEGIAVLIVGTVMAFFAARRKRYR